MLILVPFHYCVVCLKFGLSHYSQSSNVIVLSRLFIDLYVSILVSLVDKIKVFVNFSRQVFVPNMYDSIHVLY